MAGFSSRKGIGYRAIEGMINRVRAGTRMRATITVSIAGSMLMILLSATATATAVEQTQPRIDWRIVQQSDQNGYLLTVCDHLRRTLRGKTPVVLYIDGKVHLVSDVHPRTLETCVGVIFSTTPGKGLKTRQLLA